MIIPCKRQTRYKIVRRNGGYQARLIDFDVFGREVGRRWLEEWWPTHQEAADHIARIYAEWQSSDAG